jgi:hypothetical protein
MLFSRRRVRRTDDSEYFVWSGSRCEQRLATKPPAHCKNHQPWSRASNSRLLSPGRRCLLRLERRPEHAGQRASDQPDGQGAAPTGHVRSLMRMGEPATQAIGLN